MEKTYSRGEGHLYIGLPATIEHLLDLDVACFYQMSFWGSCYSSFSVCNYVNSFANKTSNDGAVPDWQKVAVGVDGGRGKFEHKNSRTFNPV